MRHPLDARRQAMLREMGVRLWTPGPAAPAAAAAAAARAAEGVRRTQGAAADAAVDDAPAAPSPARAGPTVGVAAVPPGVAGIGADADADAHAGRFAQADWQALRDVVHACRACALGTERTHAVFAAGRPPADWLLVGDVPDEAEDRAGSAFAGAPGALLDAMLRALGVSRAEDEAVGAAATRAVAGPLLRCRPTRRAATAAEVATCLSHLRRQVALQRPRVLLAMGPAAARALAGEHAALPLGRLRGMPLRFEGVPVVATFHPAWLLRHPEDKPRAWEDLCHAARIVDARDGGPKRPPIPRRHGR